MCQGQEHPYIRTIKNKNNIEHTISHGPSHDGGTKDVENLKEHIKTDCSRVSTVSLQ